MTDKEVIQEQLISYKTAKQASYAGFPKYLSTTGFYRKEDKKIYLDSGDYTHYPACTQALLQKWLREEYGLFVEAYPEPSYVEGKINWSYTIRKLTMKSMTDAMFNGTKWISKNNSYERL